MPQVTQLPLSLPFDERYGGEDFAVSPANAEAYAFIRSWPKWPAYGLIISGPEASGKTHLSCIWAAMSGARLLAAQDVPQDGDIAEKGARLVIEGADKDISPSAFFHLLNGVREQGGFVVLTSRRSVQEWEYALPDLTSRLRALPSVRLNAPDDALLAAVIRKHFHDRQIGIEEEVVHYLLPRIERSLAAARRIAGALDTAALAAKRPLSVHLARQVLEEINTL